MCGASRLRNAARTSIEVLLAGADQDLLRLSKAFDDPMKLLEAAVKFGLEGIVSKRREQPYRSGPNSGWIKVKSAAWREANRDPQLFTNCALGKMWLSSKGAKT